VSGKPFFERIGISKREFFPLFALLFNTFTWYFMILIMTSNVAEGDTGNILRTTYFIGVIGSSIIGSILSSYVKRLRFLYVWMFVGMASSSLLAFSDNFAPSHFLLIFSSLGFSFGLGMPSCLAYFSDHTSIENRGRISAIIFSASNIGALPFAILLTGLNVTISSVILTVWRGFGIATFAMLRPTEKLIVEKNEKSSFSLVLNDKRFVLYLVPWFMFSFIDRFEKIVFQGFIDPNFYQLTLAIEPVIAVLSMLIGGLLCDRIGRKRTVIYGFVSLGVAYAMIGIAPSMLLFWYLYLIIDGIAAGILWIIFIFILWGDLSQPKNREKYYVIGSIPFFLTDILSLPSTAFIRLVPANSSFSLASFFLFLAVLPLIYAPETLPEKKIQLRKLRGYAETAKKLRKKYLKKPDVAS